MGVRNFLSLIKGTKSTHGRHNIRLVQQKKFQKFQQQVAQQKQASSAVSECNSNGNSLGGSSKTSGSNSSSQGGSASSSSSNNTSSNSYFSKKSLAVQYQYYKQSNLHVEAKKSEARQPAEPVKTAPTKTRSANVSTRRLLELEAKRRSSMASVVLKSLSILLGIFFIFVGTTKLTPRVSKDLYKDLRKEYARYAKVFPLAQTLEFKVPSKWYRRGIGALEILCGTCLTFIPSKRIKQTANLTLIFMMLFATYNHWMVGDKFERIAPSLVFFFMLTCRLIVEFQIKRKENLQKKEAAEKSNPAGSAGTAKPQLTAEQSQSTANAASKSLSSKEARSSSRGDKKED